MEEKAYAKINLSLSVLGKRNDGFHELKSVMVPLELCDTIFFELDDEEISLVDDNEIPNNIIIKTAKLFKERFNIKKGAKIALHKEIPIEAGLAGGSADSSATLRGLNRLWNVNASLDELMEISKELGSDNPFCVYNKKAIIEGRGERLTFIDGKIDSDVLLIKPPYGASTREIFKNHICKNNSNRTDALLEAIHKNDINLINKATYNDLEETTMRLIPNLRELKEYISQMGYKVMMSGSGPTLFILGKKDDFEKIIDKIPCTTIITKIKN